MLGFTTTVVLLVATQPLTVSVAFIMYVVLVLGETVRLGSVLAFSHSYLNVPDAPVALALRLTGSPGQMAVSGLAVIFKSMAGTTFTSYCRTVLQPWLSAIFIKKMVRSVIVNVRGLPVLPSSQV